MSRWKLLGAAAVVAAVVIGARFLPLAHWTIQLVELIRGSGLWGVLLFVAVFAVSTVALLPGSVLTMLAGFIYGPIYRLLVVVPASLLSATSSFLPGTRLRGFDSSTTTGRSTTSRVRDTRKAPWRKPASTFGPTGGLLSAGAHRRTVPDTRSPATRTSLRTPRTHP